MKGSVTEAFKYFLALHDLSKCEPEEVSVKAVFSPQISSPGVQGEALLQCWAATTAHTMEQSCCHSQDRMELSIQGADLAKHSPAHEHFVCSVC